MQFNYEVDTVLSKEDIFGIRDQINRVKISESLERYIIELVLCNRKPLDYKLNEQAQYIQFGASPRASINLNLAAKAMAYIDGRDYVLPEDIKEIAPDVMNHRIILNYRSRSRQHSHRRCSQSNPYQGSDQQIRNQNANRIRESTSCGFFYFYCFPNTILFLKSKLRACSVKHTL